MKITKMYIRFGPCSEGPVAPAAVLDCLRASTLSKPLRTSTILKQLPFHVRGRTHSRQARRHDYIANICGGRRTTRSQNMQDAIPGRRAIADPRPHDRLAAHPRPVEKARTSNSRLQRILKHPLPNFESGDAFLHITSGSFPGISAAALVPDRTLKTVALVVDRAPNGSILKDSWLLSAARSFEALEVLEVLGGEGPDSAEYAAVDDDANPFQASTPFAAIMPDLRAFTLCSFHKALRLGAVNLARLSLASTTFHTHAAFSELLILVRAVTQSAPGETLGSTFVALWSMRSTNRSSLAPWPAMATVSVGTVDASLVNPSMRTEVRPGAGWAVLMVACCTWLWRARTRRRRKGCPPMGRRHGRRGWPGSMMRASKCGWSDPRPLCAGGGARCGRATPRAVQGCAQRA
ncbi:hypothetical protein BOTBODRAFT_64745 [Botryobasidium botryosum FD-172 SS1]|uniref:Uncharacterized protein n=1 Tax=Botryobasidium botryosum (strain FD-172 SS1) TaxID=930990 RepID=A0A067MM84_BOTB1|nr:hypothetical protein BOTBODRAFT_64745 [Botryobasidium botryosum FD-172 SS1]